jgi:hypothetical protein
MTPTDPTDHLLERLAEARTWADRFQRDLDRGVDVIAQIQAADEQIEALETKAKQALKALGCTNPQTRAVYHAMADMLIAWQIFKDTYPWFE